MLGGFGTLPETGDPAERFDQDWVGGSLELLAGSRIGGGLGVKGGVRLDLGAETTYVQPVMLACIDF